MSKHPRVDFPALPVTVAIIGSRDYPRLEFVRKLVLNLEPWTTVVSGGARGVDRTAVETAETNGYWTKEFLADWEGKGRRAGRLRNTVLMEFIAEKKGAVFAFSCLKTEYDPDDPLESVTNGTQNALKTAQKLQIPFYLVSNTPENDVFMFKFDQYVKKS